jgi:hypothetical protein
MLAVRFAVQNAPTEEKVLHSLTSFLDHLHRYRMEEILPQQLARLSARNVDDVRAWAQTLRAGVHDRYCLTAAGQLWFDEVCEIYFAAQRRLDELSAQARQLPTVAQSVAGRGPSSVGAD